MSAKHGLSNKTIESIQSVLARHPEVSRAILFGSRAKATFNPGSDIDLALVGPGVNQQSANRIHGELDDLPLPFTFSLVIPSRIEDPDVLAHIDRVGIVFYEKPDVSLTP